MTLVFFHVVISVSVELPTVDLIHISQSLKIEHLPGAEILEYCRCCNHGCPSDRAGPPDRIRGR